MMSFIETRRSSGQVRQYSRSDTPRLRWTEELHSRFIEAVDCLGGQNKATPKRILQLMGVTGLSISHVKSHLQMYRGMGSEDDLQNHSPSRSINKKRKGRCNTFVSCSHHSEEFKSNSTSLDYVNYSIQRPLFESEMKDWMPNNMTLERSNIYLQRDQYYQKNEVVPPTYSHQIAANEVNCELSLSSLNPHLMREKSEVKKPRNERSASTVEISTSGNSSSSITISDGSTSYQQLNQLNLELTM